MTAAMRGGGLAGWHQQGSTEERTEQGAHGGAAGFRGSQGTGEGIEAISLQHDRPFRPEAAVETRRQDGAESPSSGVMLLGAVYTRQPYG